MPFVGDAQPSGLSPQVDVPPETTTPTPPFRSLLDAAFRRDNSLGSLGEAAGEAFAHPMAAPNPAYDPFKDIAGYEDYAASFVGANSSDDVYHIKARIDAERRRSDLLASGGAYGMLADVIAGSADPLMLVPIGGEVVAATRAGRIGLGALRAAAGAAVGTAAQEGVLHATQETRTWGESAMNIASATLVGGVLGGAAGAIGRPVSREMAASVMKTGAVFDRELAGNIGDVVPEPAAAGEGGSIGAAAVQDTSLEQETFRSALGAEKALAFSSPTLRLGTSPALETRKAVQQLADQPLEMKKNEAGIPTAISVESMVRKWQGPLAEALTGLDDAFVQYRLGRSKKFGDVAKIGLRDLFGKPADMMTYDQFKEAVGRAMRLGDKSAIPEVQQAAETMRTKVFDPLKQRAIEAGLLPEDVSVDTALSYLTRVYDTNKIAARRPVFEQRIVDWLGEVQRTVGERVAGFRQTMQGSEGAIARLNRQGQADELMARTLPQKLEAEKKFVPVDQQLKAADRQHRRAFAAQQAAEERLAKFTPTPGLEKTDPLAELLRDVRKGGPKEPERLWQFLRRAGGLKDEGGEVSALGADNKSHPRLIRKDGGMTLDDAALKAAEEGYFPGHGGERPTANDLLDALRSDLRDQAVYSEKDDAAAAYRDYVHEFAAELDRQGIDPAKMSDAEIAQNLKGEGFREGTPAANAKAREIAYYARRAKAEVDRLAGKVKEIQAEWDRLKAEGEGASKQAKALAAAKERRLAEIAKHERIVERMQKRIDEHQVFASSGPGDLKDIARQITDNLLHMAPGRIGYQPVPLTRGPLKERTLAIPDAAIEDFLNSDIHDVARIYTRTMATDTELARAFGRADMEDQLNKVRENYAQLRAGVTDEAALRKLDARERADLRDLAAVRDRIRGTYSLPDNPNGLWNRSYHVVRDLNYLRLLGGMTMSALPDPGSIVMKHGITRVFGDGLIPMLSNWRQFRLAAEEVKLAGNALDMVLDTRAMSIADVMDDYGRWSKYERGLKGLTERFGLITLMAPWNAAMKQFAGVISQTRALQAIEKLAAGETVKAAERTRLAHLGIGPGTIERIAAEFRQHGTKDSGVWWANTAAWADKDAADAFRAAMSKEIDTIIVTPGQEKPLWMTKGVGKVIGQFRSFTIASTQRVMLSGLQRRDMATLNGAALMVGLGSLSYYLKGLASGSPMPDPTTPSGAAKWVSEGIDQSGLAGWLFDVNNITEKLTRGGVGLSRLTGQPMMSRYASRGAVESLLGPTVGFAEGAANALGGIFGKDPWTTSDSSAARRMIPLQNVIGLRHIFDLAEQGINDALGVKKPDRATRH